MIVYRELSSLVSDLGYSAKTLYSVSHSVDAHYREVCIPKDNGEMRRLSVPDRLLKSIQKKINEVLLPLEQISPYAAAYRPGGSTLRNACPHVGRPKVLKLDIYRFFDRVIYSLVKEKAFPASRYSESNRILLAILCTHDNKLPQGAPTSPAVSNIILKDFDLAVGEWCRQRDIAYTRYCDDMTFSGDFDHLPVIRFVEAELKKLGLFLNRTKTRVIADSQRQQVTGIIVNEKVSVPKSYKRQIRQAVYYCQKYGVYEHLNKTGSKTDKNAFLAELRGRINYVLSVEPDNEEMKKYRAELKSLT